MFAPACGGHSLKAGLTGNALCQVASKLPDRRMLEDQIGGELQTEPILEFDDQIDRIRRIKAKAGEFHIRIDGLLRQVECPRQVLHTPLSNLIFTYVAR
jgi:hypothetical protein